MSASFKRLHARAPISLTKSGEFQFGGTLCKSALLISSVDIYDWGLGRVEVDEPGILKFLDEVRQVRGDFLLLGTGRTLQFPSLAFRSEIDRRVLGLEVMDTSAACRTYNVLLAEGRFFTAALLTS
jgi:uncharacterized protein